ncbi:MAG: peptidoglycan DD-metalloendopeptidase family protein [Evtepia sp.]|uniref:murein hydrolase activator EnvC family protein n=1 Tax=Evtepia sp. TaxID=2773933 RepID=UPI002A7495F4|nr:peptidoglycan DD-metalloendopeptidase family protein [Evtepia sp.]MDY3015205.1 peptidoglycan DD-metalloendopeptidase family protein [Evtepia sp.]
MQHPFQLHGWSKRLGALGLALVMVLFALTAVLPPASAAVTQEQINSLKSKASSLSQQKADLQKELDKLSQQENSALDQKLSLEKKINILREEIAVSEQAIANYGEMIQQKEAELAKAQEEEAKYYEEFRARVRSMEENGSISYWSVLFSATSFSDLLDRMNAVRDVMDYDNKIMDQLEKARQAVADAKAGLEESKAAEEAVRAQLTQQKADLEAEQAKVEQLIAQINSQSSTYAAQLAEIEEDADTVSKQITSAEAAYKAQLEAQRKAEEEKKKQEQEQANQGNQGGGGSSPSGSGGYIWPLPGYTRISSPFGYRNCPFHGKELHGGIDIPANYGTPIKAAKSGVVIISTYGSSYGNYIVISHSDGSRTMYAHQSSRAVSAGQTVSQGQTIGYVGSTGSSTGNHLHFEVWKGSSSSSRVNPMNYF